MGIRATASGIVPVIGQCVFVRSPRPNQDPDHAIKGTRGVVFGDVGGGVSVGVEGAAFQAVDAGLLRDPVRGTVQHDLWEGGGWWAACRGRSGPGDCGGLGEMEPQIFVLDLLKL